MEIPYTEIFVGLLAVYMGYSIWARLDGRYPIAAALVLLVATAVVDALGDVTAANSLAEYVFFLLAAGVVLLLIEHVRERAPSSPTPALGSPATERVSTEAPYERKRATDQSLNGLEEKAVPFVDRSRDYDEQDEQTRDPEAEDR